MSWGDPSTECSQPASVASSSHPRYGASTMSMATTRPMSLIRFDFNALYARHLCRHSQFGINVVHLAALYGLWFGVYATIAQTVLLLDIPPSWPLTALALAYLAVVAL